ncbi:MAG: glycoside hydrolase family 10 protein, partial [Verrucomicrobiota bacterium]
MRQPRINGRGAFYSVLAVMLFCTLALPLAARETLASDDASLLPPNGWSSGTACPAPNAVHTDAETTALRFHAPFDQPAFPERASWDVPIKADLRMASGLQLRIRCPDTGAVRQFTIYLKSGDGWYAAHFMPAADDQWQTLKLRKEHLDIEGNPAGWNHISKLRIAIWKADARATSADIADIQAVQANSPVLVVRGLSDKTGTRSTDAVRYAKNVTSALRRRGIRPALVEESDLTPSLFNSAQLTILPYNPSLSNERAALLKRQLADGHSIIGFYTVPESLQPILGLHHKRYLRSNQLPAPLANIRPSSRLDPAIDGIPPRMPQASWMVQELEYDPDSATAVGSWFTNEGADTELPAILRLPHGYWITHVLLNEVPDSAADLLLALSADQIPSLWPQASAHAIRSCGKNVDIGSVQQTLKALAAQTDHNPRAKSLVNRAAARFRRAHAMHQKRNYPAAIRQANQANSLIEQLYLRTRPNHPDEIRALWVANPKGDPEGSWDSLVKRARENGFSTLFVHMADGVSAHYPSTPLADKKRAKTRGQNLLAEALQAGRKYNVQIHPWIQVFHVNTPVTPGRLQQLRDNGELAHRRGTGVDNQWLCPSHPKVRKRILAAIDELLTRYQVPGIHLDYIRHGSSRHCVCPRCQADFEQALGHNLPNWPDALDTPEIAQKWRAFRRKQISTLVQQISRLIDTRSPDAVLSAAVFSDLQISRTAVGQDWIQWCRNQWLDAVCPMNYEQTATAFADRISKQTRALRSTRVALIPGIGATARNLSLLEITRQIEATRSRNLPGFAIFQANSHILNTVMPALENLFKIQD